VVVGAYAFEDAVAVEQAVVEDADGGIFGGDDFAVEPDLFGHCVWFRGRV
jgi:hypothetical protein